MASSKNSSSSERPWPALSRMASLYSPDPIALSKMEGFEVSPVTEYELMYLWIVPSSSMLRVMLSSHRLWPRS